MKTAVVHHWLEQYTGGEKVVEEILNIFPDATLYTLIYHSENFHDTTIAKHEIITSFIERLPWGRTKYRQYLALMPLAIEQFDLSEYDIILSSCSSVAKGVLKRADQLHISYVHSPIRYAWDLYQNYLTDTQLRRGVKGIIARAILHYIRMWDFMAAARPDILLANSHYIAERIWNTYRREAQVVYPPVDIDRFDLSCQRDDYYLTLSRFVPYKKIDLIVEAFSRMGKPLFVIGDGPDRAKIEALAGKNVTLLGKQPDDVVKKYMEGCKAFVFAADEDFGIAPVEAQAAGAPVICYGRGGVLETVIPGETGVHFSRQTTESLIEAIETFESTPGRFSPERIRENAERFSAERFRREFSELVEREWNAFSQPPTYFPASFRAAN